MEENPAQLNKEGPIKENSKKKLQRVIARKFMNDTAEDKVT